MIVLTGASASGKTEVAKLLAKKYSITKTITTTTREPRTNEIHGKDYFFVSKEEFENMLRSDKFVEHTIFNGNYYGSTKDQVSNDKCIVIDIAGLRSYIALKNPTIVTFYLETDEKTRLDRMIKRGDDEGKIKKRIANDREIFKKESLPKVDYIIQNNSSCSLEEIADDIFIKYKNKIG